jgi:glycosyltransferase involved in cell wall biosynthesis
MYLTRELTVRIAFVHEWFTTYAGSEKVLEVMLSDFPEADVFCLIDCWPEKRRSFLAGKAVRTTYMQKIPFISRMYRYLLFLMPFAIEQLDLSVYDVIISNSHAVAKGVITGPDQLHICYCYSPMRYAWDLHSQYLTESGLQGVRSLIARWQLHLVRTWDYRVAQNVDHFIACSAYISRRIRKAYRRDSTVIYPNVAVDRFVIDGSRDDFYLTSSRLVPYKKIPLVVEAFSKMPDRKLVVIGSGAQLKRTKALAGPNVKILGYQPDSVLIWHMQRAKAFIFAAEEDFGITPVEAQACGTPVLAFSRGGASETVLDGKTGLLFHQQTSAAIQQVVRDFEAMQTQFDPEVIRAHALRFSTERFRDEFRRYVYARWREHIQTVGTPDRRAALPETDGLDARVCDEREGMTI